MVFKRLLGTAVLLTVLAFSASASTVSFMVVETGLSEETSSPQYSSLWEGGLMSIFFEAGHIVTNNPILRMDKQFPTDIRGTVLEKDLDEAALGGAEYIVLGMLEYQMQGNRPIPAGINIKIYTTVPQQLVYEQKFPAGSGRNSNEENQIVQNAGRTIISQIKDR